MPAQRHGTFRVLGTLVVIVLFSYGPRGSAALYLEPQVEGEEMWQEVILLSRRTPTASPQLQVQIWPLTHPAQPPSSRMMRYLPYHPMVRFRGPTFESRPLMHYYYEPDVRVALFYRHPVVSCKSMCVVYGEDELQAIRKANTNTTVKHRSKKNPSSSDLWQLLSHLALQRTGRYGQSLRFGFSKRR